MLIIRATLEVSVYLQVSIDSLCMTSSVTACVGHVPAGDGTASGSPVSREPQVQATVALTGVNVFIPSASYNLKTILRLILHPHPHPLLPYQDVADVTT